MLSFEGYVKCLMNVFMIWLSCKRWELVWENFRLYNF